MRPRDILEHLASGATLMCDGGMGTALQNAGMPTGACPEEYNISHPDIVQKIYSDYLAAGSDIIETNTFGANRSRLALHNFESRVPEFCRRSAELAREVCPPNKFVAGSMGPTGDILQPLGTLSLQQATDFFGEQAAALASGGVHLIFVETMMAAEEAEIAIAAAKATTGLPVAATMTFELGKAGLRTMWGVDVPTAVQRLTSAGADIIGANCGKGFDEMLAIVKEMRPLTTRPILAQSNAGIPEWVAGKSVYKETPASIRPKAEELLKLGVNILGGCCGTGPAHISMMRKLVDAGTNHGET